MSRHLGFVRTWISDRFRPQKQRHIIFDMDETLVHSFEGRDMLAALRIASNPRLSALRPRLYLLESGIWGVTRPHFEKLIRTAFDTFSTVTVWSAGEKEYVNGVVKHIFHGFPKPDIIMTRNDCEIDVASDDFYYTKPLRVAGSYYEQLGRRDVHMNETNTLIVEDRASAIDSEDRFNSVLVPPYIPDAAGEALLRDDPALKILSDWFAQDQFRRAADVRYVLRPTFYSMPVPKTSVTTGRIIRRPTVYVGR